MQSQLSLFAKQKIEDLIILSIYTLLLAVL